MRLFEIISLKAPHISPENSKVHLATPNGAENPLDLFFAGEFESWQSWQKKRNFERPFIVSLIKLGRDRWLFAGCYRCLGRTREDGEKDSSSPLWKYQTQEEEALGGLAGRLVVSFERSGRASYLNADKWSERLFVDEMLRKRMSVGTFPGYREVIVPKPTLDLITHQEVPSWKGALSSVAGVYLITDTRTGKLYVGSASGEEGIWGRWLAYASTGHGGNQDLQSVLEEKGLDYARHWQWSILEIADTHATTDEILSRESHWKRVLGSREHGYNRN